MLKSKRWSVSLVASILVLSLLLSACSSNDGGETQSDGEKIKIRFMARAIDGPYWEVVRERVDEFMKQNPNIVVEQDFISDESAYNNKLKVSFASDDVPELFTNFGGEAFKQYVENGIVADLSQDLESNKEWKDDFLPLLDNWMYKDMEGVYGVPNEFYGVVIFYNKELFKSAGVEVPKTLSEFYQVSEKLNEAGIIPMALGEKDIWRGAHVFTNLLYKKFGPSIIDDLASRKASYADPEIVDVFNEIKNMNDKGIFGANAVGVDYNAEIALFENEKTAMHMDGSWYLPGATQASIKDKIGIFSFPYYDDAAANQNHWMGGAASGLSISKELEGEKREATIKLLQFLTSKEMFSLTRDKGKGGVYPVKLDESSEIDPLTLEFNGLIAQAESFYTDVTTYDPLPQVEDKLRNALQGMIAGSKPEAAAKDVADEIQKRSK